MADRFDFGTYTTDTLNNLVGYSHPMPGFGLDRAMKSLPSPEVRDRMRRDLGEYVVPHQFSFGGVYNAHTKTYRTYFDEALRASWEDALALRRDTMVSALLQNRALPVAEVTYRIEPDDPADPSQAACAKRAQKIYDAIPRIGDYRMGLLEAQFFGKAAMQSIFGFEDVDGERVKTIVDHVPVNGDKIVWRWGRLAPAVMVNPGYVSFAGVEPIAMETVYGDRGPAIPLDHPSDRMQYAFHRFRPTDADYQYESDQSGQIGGLGLRGRIYHAWWMRTEVLSWFLDGLQRIGANGQRYAFYDEGDPSSRDATLQALMMLNRDNVAVFPKGKSQVPTTIEHTPPTDVAYNVMLDIVKYFDDIIRRLILGQDLSSTTAPTGLGSGVAKLHQDVLNTIIRSDAKSLAETETREVLGPIVRMNRWKYRGREVRKLPFKLHVRPVLDGDDAMQRLQAAQMLLAMNVPIDLEKERDRAGFDAPDPKVVAAMQAQQAAQAQQQPPQGGPPAGGPPQGGPPQGDPNAPPPGPQQMAADDEVARYAGGQLTTPPAISAPANPGPKSPLAPPTPVRRPAPAAPKAPSLPEPGLKAPFRFPSQPGGKYDEAASGPKPPPLRLPEAPAAAGLPRTDPGHPIHSENFKGWFGDWKNDPANASKVVHPEGHPEAGTPREVYHGTVRGGFDRFGGEHDQGTNLFGPGHYFTEDPEIAASYTKKDEARPRLKHAPEEATAEIRRRLEARKAADLGEVASGKIPASLPGVTSPDQAREFIEASHRDDLSRAGDHPEAFHDRPEMADLYHRPEANPEVKRAYLNVRNPFDADSGRIDPSRLTPEVLQKAGLSDRAEGLRRASGPLEYHDLARVLGPGHDFADRDAANRVLRALGHDGITHIGGGRYTPQDPKRHRVHIAFHPSQVKAVENQGQFDPSNEFMHYEGSDETARYGGPGSGDPRVMIAMKLPAEAADRISIPGGEPAGQLHVTLAYLGRRSSLGRHGLDGLAWLLGRLAGRCGPLAGSLGGWIAFPASSTSGGLVPVCRTVDVPGLAELRSRICDGLDAVGIEARSDHGFTPHVTVDYRDPAELELSPTGKPVPVRFAEVCLVVGKHWRPFRLDGRETLRYARDEKGEPCPKGECCPHCGARLERGDDGRCNRCGEEWPIRYDDGIEGDDQVEQYDDGADAMGGMSGSLGMGGGALYAADEPPTRYADGEGWAKGPGIPSPPSPKIPAPGNDRVPASPAGGADGKAPALPRYFHANDASHPRQTFANWTRKSPWGDDHPDPAAQAVLRHEHADAIFGAIPPGSRPLGAGFDAAVLETPEGDVARVGPFQQRENTPSVLRPTRTDRFGDYMVERLPRADTSGVTDADVESMRRQLHAEGYEFVDAGTDNLGRTRDGRLVVLDPGAVRPIQNAKATPEKGVSRHRAADAVERYASVHAPHNVTVQGKPYRGGEFIPGDVVASASPQEKAALGVAGPPPGGQLTTPPPSPMPMAAPRGVPEGPADESEHPFLADDLPASRPWSIDRSGWVAPPHWTSHHEAILKQAERSLRPGAFLSDVDPAGRPAADSKRQAYGQSFLRAVQGMPAGLAKAVAKGLHSVVFRPTYEDINRDIQKFGASLSAGSRTYGFAVTHAQGITSLYLDNGGRMGDGTPVHRHEVYAHEMGHVADATGDWSERPEWAEAFEQEIRSTGRLSEYATSHPAEGFAEFARLVSQQPIAVVEHHFPKCTLAWRAFGLL